MAKKISLAGVFRRWWPAYVQRFGGEGGRKILPSHHAAAAAIMSCGTPERGGSLYACTGCGKRHFAWHTCGHRACPKCGYHHAEQWEARQKEKLLPVPYYMITFTIPEQLRAFFRSHQKLCYELFFKESAGALQDIAQDPDRLGATLGFTGVLQTWTRTLIYHPHIHYIVAGGGIAEDGNQRFWKRPKNPNYFLPHQVLADRLRTRLRAALKAADPQLFQEIPSIVWDRQKIKHWVCDVEAVGSGAPAIGYLARYVTKTAIGSKRLRTTSGKEIAFDYIESDTGRQRTCQLAPFELLRRFLQHIQPRGFRAVRGFGWMSPAAKKTLQRISLWLKGIDYREPSPDLRSDRRYPKCRHCGKPMLPSDEEVPDDLRLAYEASYYRKHPSHRPRPPDLVFTRKRDQTTHRSLASIS